MSLIVPAHESVARKEARRSGPFSQTALRVQNATEDRTQTEAFIYQGFKTIHDAEVDHFLPVLLSAFQADELKAALGIQLGSQGPMFLEQYLDAPIEQQIAALKELPVSRCSIAEIGNLVIQDRLSGSALMLVMVSALHQAGLQWLAFTATAVVKNMIEKMGYSPFYLADANAEKLQQGNEQWGRYYELRPRVMIGSLAEMNQAIQNSPVLSMICEQLEDQIELATRAFKRERSLPESVRV